MIAMPSQYSLVAKSAAASVGGLAIAAHEKPLLARRQRKPRKLTEAEIEKMKASAEIARQGAQGRMEKAEIKRLRKAQRRQELIAEGKAKVLPDKEEKLMLPAKHSSIVMGGKLAEVETKSERDARKKREKRAAEKAAKLAA